MEQRKDWAMDVYLLSMIGTQDTADLEAEHYVTLSTCSYEYENARFVLVASLKNWLLINSWAAPK